MFLRNNVSSVLKLLDLKNPLPPSLSLSSDCSQSHHCSFSCVSLPSQRPQPISNSTCQNSAPPFPNISSTLQTNITPPASCILLPSLIFCLTSPPSLYPETLISIINNFPYLSFNPFSPSSSPFSSPYLETPFCSPNQYPRMPNTPPSLVNPVLFPHLV